MRLTFQFHGRDQVDVTEPDDAAREIRKELDTLGA
jgi:hypothetical protein